MIHISTLIHLAFYRFCLPDKRAFTAGYGDVDLSVVAYPGADQAGAGIQIGVHHAVLASYSNDRHIAPPLLFEDFFAAGYYYSGFRTGYKRFASLIGKKDF